MATPQAQPQVNDVITRIKKGEFNGADYVLFGVVSSIEFTDALTGRAFPAAATIPLLPARNSEPSVGSR